MLVPSDWRFVAEGNAHLVYRYIGPPSEHFTGMVLKLPKNGASNDDDRLFHQHRFVQGIVVGDPFSQQFGRDVRAGSFNDQISIGACSEDYSEEMSDDHNELHREWNSFDIPPNQSDTDQSTDPSTVQEQRRSDPPHPTVQNHLASFTRQKLRLPPPDRGLVSPVHIPAQKLHLFEDRQTVKLREQVPSGKMSQSSLVNSNLVLQDRLIRDPSLNSRSTSPSIRPHILNPESSPSSFYSRDPGLSPRLSRSSFALLERDLVTPPFSPSRLLSVGAHCNLSNQTDPCNDVGWIYFTCELKPKTGLPAVVKQESVLREVAPNSEAPNSEAPKSEVPKSEVPKSEVPKSEVPKSEVPSSDVPNSEVLNSDYPASPALLQKSQTEDELKLADPASCSLGGIGHEVSRFTMQQYLKLTEKVVKRRSHFLPEVFFGRLSDREDVRLQLRALLLRPQNNWRMFIDGARIIWTDDQKQIRQASRLLSEQTTTHHHSVPSEERSSANWDPPADWSSSVVLTVQKSQQSTDLSVEHQKVRAFGFHASDIFPFWMAWSNPTKKTEEKIEDEKLKSSSSVLFSEPKDSYSSSVFPLFSQMPILRLITTRCELDEMKKVELRKGLAETTPHTSPKQSFPIDVTEQSKSCNDRTQLFHSVFPTEILLGEDESSRRGLEAWTDLVGEVLTIESNLFYRLLYVHALCEGQQLLAAELLNQLKIVGWIDDDVGSNHLIDQKLMSVAHGAESLKELLIGMEADIARDNSWTFPRQDKACDSEALFALKVQTWHWCKGRELIDIGKSLLESGKDFPEPHIQRIVLWIYRFLIGRTFLDCSVMINIAISYDDQIEEEDAERLIGNRFVKLSSLALSSLDHEISIKDSSSKEDRDSSKTADEIILFETLQQALRGIRVPVFSTTGGQTWHTIQQLVELSGVKKSPNGSMRMLSIWYRLSVVDLDLKRASKIPQWAKQLDNILQAFHDKL